MTAMDEETRSAIDELAAYCLRPAIPVAAEDLQCLKLGVERPATGWKLVVMTGPTESGPWRVYGEAPMVEGGTSVGPNAGATMDQFTMSEMLGALA